MLNISTGLRQNFSLNSFDVSGSSSGLFLSENRVVNNECFQFDIETLPVFSGFPPVVTMDKEIAFTGPLGKTF